MGFQDDMATEVFGLVVFLDEGLVRVHRKGGESPRTPQEILQDRQEAAFFIFFKGARFFLSFPPELSSQSSGKSLATFKAFSF